MNWFSQLRVLVLLRRGVKALESIAASQSVISMYAARDWDERHRLPMPQGLRKHVHLDTFDPIAASERYRKEQLAEGIEVDDIG